MLFPDQATFTYLCRCLYGRQVVHHPLVDQRFHALKAEMRIPTVSQERNVICCCVKGVGVTVWYDSMQNKLSVCCHFRLHDDPVSWVIDFALVVLHEYSQPISSWPKKKKHFLGAAQHLINCFLTKVCRTHR